MSKGFELESKYQPAGDQPKAIEALVDGLESGLASQTLLGVTGSGKTFTMANIIKQVQRPTLIMAHNKTLAAQLYGEMKEFFRTMRWNISFPTTTIISRKRTFPVPILLLRKMRQSTTTLNKCGCQRQRH